MIANRQWNAGEILKFLAGTIVAMTEEEEDYYETDHDFSIIHSSRLDSMCLFLGPARFVNHDCSPNGAFVTQGGSIAITAVKPIALGEEITVFYSPDYFGPGNNDCLCMTCESRACGGYSVRPKDVSWLQEKQFKSESSSHQQTNDRSCVAVSLAHTKRNQVQTIEVESKKSPAQALLSQVVAPPDSESSLEDITKGIQALSDTDIFQSADEDCVAESPSEDDDVYIKGEESESEALSLPSKHMANSRRIARLETSFSKRSASEISSLGNKAVVGARKSLRPRKPVQDYNLKRQSLLSLIPNALYGDMTHHRLRKERKLDMNYCSVCDDELAQTAVIEEIWSNRAAIGIKRVLCKKCERHEKLYKNPWPTRTSKLHVEQTNNRQSEGIGATSRGASPSSNRMSAEQTPGTFSPKKKLDLASALSFRAASTDRPTSCSEVMSAIEEAKAEMKRGNMYLPRLSAPLQAGLVSTIGCDSRAMLPITLRDNETDALGTQVSLRPQSSAKGVPLSLHPTCLDCRQENRKCNKNTVDAMCTRCVKLQRTCTYVSKSLINDGPDIWDFTDTEDIGATPTSRSSMFSHRPVSPDSQLAAFQVRSPKRLNRRSIIDYADNGIFDFNASPEHKPVKNSIKSPELALSSQITPCLTATPGRLKRKPSPSLTFENIRKESLNGKATGKSGPERRRPSTTSVCKSFKSIEPAMDAQKAFTNVKSPRASENFSQRPRSSTGSWYYVEVESSDSEDASKLLTIGRTRRQEKLVSQEIPKVEEKVYIELETSDDESLDVLPYRPPTKRQKTAVRRPRKPLWEYVSVDSDEEDPKPVVVSGPRSARRAVSSYKE